MQNLVNCRIGSLEIISSGSIMKVNVNCRTGSLDKKKLRSSSMEKVNCRIGSLETSVCESVVLLGCVTEGDTLSEAIDMAGDALGIYLYSLKKTKRLIRSRLIRLISRQKAVTLLF